MRIEFVRDRCIILMNDSGAPVAHGGVDRDQKKGMAVTLLGEGLEVRRINQKKWEVRTGRGEIWVAETAEVVTASRPHDPEAIGC